MATTKKKSARKTHAAKRHAQPSVKASRSASRATPNQAAWANQAANQWQKGASEWAKQSTKLYQMPFQAGDVNEATRQAAQTVQSATENMMRASTDMMSQFFGAQPVEQLRELWANGKIPAANASLQNFGRDAGNQLSRTASNAQRTLAETAELTRENAETLVECGNTAISVSKEIGAELISFANRTFAQNVEISKELLSCRTLNDMFDLSGKFIKSNLDGYFSESVKLSEMLFNCANDVSEPLNERLSESTERLSKTFAA